MPLRGCFHTCFWHLHYCIPTFFASQPSFAAYGVCSCFYLPRILCSRLAQKYDCAHHAWVTGQDRENGKASTDWRVSLFFTCLSLWCKQLIVSPVRCGTHLRSVGYIIVPDARQGVGLPSGLHRQKHRLAAHRKLWVALDALDYYDP